MAAADRMLRESPERNDLLRTWPRIGVRTIIIGLLVVLVYNWGLQGTQASPAELVEGIPNIIDFLKRMFPPEFETETQTLQTPAIPLPFVDIPRAGLSGVEFQFPVVVYAIIETIQMAVIGTTLAIVLASPFAILAARNISPYPVVYQTTRFLLNANRAVPDIIFALVFVAAVGLGPFSGVLALAIGSIGFMGKVYAESIEAIDAQQVLAVKATGANRMQTIRSAVLPQAMPMIASYSLLLFESNVRSATILGIVGAGGIGFELQKYISLFQYKHLLGALLIIIVVVTVIDRLSDRIRKNIIEGGAGHQSAQHGHSTNDAEPLMDTAL